MDVVTEEAPSQTVYALLAQLQTVANTCAVVASRHSHVVRAVDILQPQLGVVLQGRKQISCGDTQLNIHVGEILLSKRACSVNVANLTDDHGQCYATVCIPISETVLQAARLLQGEAVLTMAAEPAIACEKIDVCAQALSAWAGAVLAEDEVAARLALTQVVLHLVAQGHSALLLPPSKDLAAQIYDLVRNSPAHAWQSAEIEQHLHLSGATLRRRLAAQGSSLKQVILHARLNCALDMLYTSTWPLKTIAAKCGYQSVSVLNQRFLQRYGLLPADIRSE